MIVHHSKGEVCSHLFMVQPRPPCVRCEASDPQEMSLRLNREQCRVDEAATSGSSGDERRSGGSGTSCRLRGEPEYASSSDTVRSDALSPGLLLKSAAMRQGLLLQLVG